MANRFQNRPFQNRARPNRAWSTSVQQSATTVAAASKVLLGNFTLANTNIDETVLRIVGVISVKSDQAASAEEQRGAFGLIRVSEAALAIGITAIPGPFTDGADQWFGYQSFVQAVDFRTAAGFALYTVQYMIDQKAKRIVSEGQVLAIVAENSHATHGLTLGFQIRMLTMVRGTR